MYVLFDVEFQMRHFGRFSNTVKLFFQSQVHEDGIFLANDFLSFTSISTGRCIIFQYPNCLILQLYINLNNI